MSDVSMINGHIDGDRVTISRERYDELLRAEEKQIPKKPKLYTDTIQGIDCSIEQDVYLCPTCDEFCCFMNENEQQFNYCSYCGQAIDWSDV